MSTQPLRVAIIGGVRFDSFEPHAGGLERHSDLLARALIRAGHSVTVFAGHGPSAGVAPYEHRPVTERVLRLSEEARRDVSMPPMEFMVEHDAYLRLESEVTGADFDVVHNNSLHYLPVLWRCDVPIVHTLHTPPTPWLESAHRIRRERSDRGHLAVSVSHANGRAWGAICDGTIHNGIELDRWSRSPVDGTGVVGGMPSNPYAVWTGRFVPEKGPVHAIRAAKALGIPLMLAGPVHDPVYFDAVVRPELDCDRSYVGHLGVDDVALLVAGASVTFVTPLWQEPFGLVVAESAAAGTPIAAYDTGAMTELVHPTIGRLARPGDPHALASSAEAALRLDRAEVRRSAIDRFSDDRMAQRYTDLYRDLVAA
ncbi:MAG: glycosyltransferase [Ilumatobacteraceae bacterium]